MGGDSSGSSGTLGESQAVEITGKIMVVAIIFLFFVVVFVIFLHLYAKCFWLRIGESTAPQRGSRRRRRFVFATGQDPAMYGTHRIGLDPAVLRSLPVVVYQPEDFKDGLECAVCLSELVQGEKARLLPKCNHGFHVDCIDMWFQSHSTCPLCRNPVASESCKPSSSSNARENVSENSLLSEADNSGAMSDLESPNFPTNVLILGDHTQVSSISDSLEEGTSQPPCFSSSTSSSSTTNSNNSRRHGMLVIDIPSEFTSSSLSPSASRFAEQDLKSPMTARLRSLKRLLSWDKRSSPYSPSSIDVEQAGRGQS